MKTFETPKINISKFISENIITTSGVGGEQQKVEAFIKERNAMKDTITIMNFEIK